MDSEEKKVEDEALSRYAKLMRKHKATITSIDELTLDFSESTETELVENWMKLENEHVSNATAGDDIKDFK
jgi:hypothetical protein